MIIFALFSFFPQWIAPYSPKDMFEPWAPMSAAHWLGTNDMGYDILSELIYAASKMCIRDSDYGIRRCQGDFATSSSSLYSKFDKCVTGKWL